MALACASGAAAQQIPDGAYAPNGGYRATTPSAIVNPNNGAPCVVGNSGCPGAAVTPQPQSGAAFFTAATTSIGTASTLIDAAQTRRSYVKLHNPANPGGPYFTCFYGASAALNGGGGDTIQAGQYLTYENSAAPNGAINCIGSAAGTAITVSLVDQ